MNPLTIIAEDSNLSENQLRKAHTKQELALRLSIIINAYTELTTKSNLLESKLETLQKRYDKLYDNFEIFGPVKNVGNYVE